jgi:Fe-S cluster assembly protein SufD
MVDSVIKTQEAAKLLNKLPKLDFSKDNFLVSNREEARDRFLKNGLPVAKEEYWRFTQPKHLFEIEEGSSRSLTGSETMRLDHSNEINLVFSDGKFRKDLSDKFSESDIEIHSLKDLDHNKVDWISKLYGKIEKESQEKVVRSLASLNTAVSSEGICLKIKKSINKNIIFKYLKEEETPLSMIHNLIKLEVGASATVIEKGESARLVNQVLEMEIGENASLDHIRLQGKEKSGTILTHNFVKQQRKSSFKSFTLTLSGKLTRNECFVSLEGEDSSMSISGAFIGKDEEHHDDTVFIRHNAERCESRAMASRLVESTVKLQHLSRHCNLMHLRKLNQLNLDLKEDILIIA